MLNTKHITNSEEETIELGKNFASNIVPGDIIYFYGDLGSGKTEFIKGICEYFKVIDIVTSPTFTIMNKYIGEKKGNEIAIFHIDLYRIEKDKELDEIGFEDCLFENNSIKLIEWAEKAESLLNKPTYMVKITPDEYSENSREITISESEVILN
jgi:tRNA threonylcarbamoyladenosine biosynthesis protein TsaE